MAPANARLRVRLRDVPINIGGTVATATTTNTPISATGLAAAAQGRKGLSCLVRPARARHWGRGVAGALSSGTGAIYPVQLAAVVSRAGDLLVDPLSHLLKVGIEGADHDAGMLDFGRAGGAAKSAAGFG